MFYPAFYTPKPNFSLRPVEKMKIIGYLVRMGKQLETVMPDHQPVMKQGRKQFWFYHNHKAMIAIQQNNGHWTAKFH